MIFLLNFLLIYFRAVEQKYQKQLRTLQQQLDADSAVSQTEIAKLKSKVESEMNRHKEEEQELKEKIETQREVNLDGGFFKMWYNNVIMMLLRVWLFF